MSRLTLTHCDSSLRPDVHSVLAAIHQLDDAINSLAPYRFASDEADISVRTIARGKNQLIKALTLMTARDFAEQPQ